MFVAPKSPRSFTSSHGRRFSSLSPLNSTDSFKELHALHQKVQDMARTFLQVFSKGGKTVQQFPYRRVDLRGTNVGVMKTIQDEIEARIRELLPDADGSTSTGWIQIESCRNTLLRGNVLMVLRRPGSFPMTHSYRGRLSNVFRDDQGL